MRKNKYTSKEREASNRYSLIKTRMGGNINWDRKDFILWYVNTTKKCYYCECTEKQLTKFHEITKSKRYKTRGNSLEIERLKDESYSKNNCVFACYWCNNAKSDVFSPKKFKSIGLEIGKVIRRSIKK